MSRVAAVVTTLFAVILAALIWAGHANASPLNSTHRACVAFQTWNHHRTMRNASIMYASRIHASKVVRTDIEVVYTEFRQNDWYDLPSDVHFTALDCKGK